MYGGAKRMPGLQSSLESKCITNKMLGPLEHLTMDNKKEQHRISHSVLPLIGLRHNKCCFTVCQHANIDCDNSSFCHNDAPQSLSLLARAQLMTTA